MKTLDNIEAGPIHHKVFEYDGLFECQHCKRLWGAGYNVPKEEPADRLYNSRNKL